MLAEATKKPKSPKSDETPRRRQAQGNAHQDSNQMALKSKRKILKDMMDRRLNSDLFVEVQEKFVVSIKM